MTAEQRRRELTQIFLREGAVKVGQLARRFGVTTETIRKDLILLEQQGLIRRGNGRAEVANELTEQTYGSKAREHVEQKQAIAALAAQQIPENASVFLDAGSTVHELARQLLFRKDLTVITNFMPTAALLSANGLKVILIGGEIRPTSGGATGPLAVEAIGQLHADLAVLSTSGFAGADGPCVENLYDASVKRAMIRQAEKVLVLTDHSKAAWRAMVCVVPLVPGGHGDCRQGFGTGCGETTATADGTAAGRNRIQIKGCCPCSTPYVIYCQVRLPSGR